MTHAHNLFLRGLNSVYQQGPHVHDPKDAQDLLIFCHAWVISLEHHHEVEETQLFPGLAAVTDDADICAREKEDHKFLHENLGRFEKYVTETKPEVYRWEDLKAVMDAFVPTLRTHLDEEIKSMLALEQVEDKAGLWKVWENTEEAAKAFNHPRVFVSAGSTSYFPHGRRRVRRFGRQLTQFCTIGHGNAFCAWLRRQDVRRR